MKRLLLVVVVAACGSKSPPPPVGNTAGPAPDASTFASCGTVEPEMAPEDSQRIQQCFLDAYHAGTPGSVALIRFTIEGDRIDYIYDFDGTTLQQMVDDREDKFSGAPGLHKSTCTSLRMDGEWLVADGCQPL